MLKSFLELFTQQVEQQAASTATLELATAALMYEVVNADTTIESSEEEQVRKLLRAHFKIDQRELEALMQTGAANAKDAVDLVQFTRVINQHYSLEERSDILHKLWLVAYADNHLDMHEEHIIRRIADLMHIPHSYYIKSKLNAKESL